LLYDLTSTFLRVILLLPEATSAGWLQWDKRFDCVQVGYCLDRKSGGVPPAYEVLAGNTATRRLARVFEEIAGQYGKAERIWVMDRGIPTEEVLEEMRRVTRRSTTW